MCFKKVCFKKCHQLKPTARAKDRRKLQGTHTRAVMQKVPKGTRTLALERLHKNTCIRPLYSLSRSLSQKTRMNPQKTRTKLASTAHLSRRGGG